MFTFEQNKFDDEHDLNFDFCNQLQTVANQLGIDTYQTFDADMTTEELQTVRQTLESIIEANYEAKRDEMRKLKLCPQGYHWHTEGTGWRCDGGSHYCSAEEIKKFME